MEPTTQSARVFISYRSQDPDRTLANEFFESLKAAGHQPFMAVAGIRLRFVLLLVLNLAVRNRLAVETAATQTRTRLRGFKMLKSLLVRAGGLGLYSPRILF